MTCYDAHSSRAFYAPLMRQSLRTLLIGLMPNAQAVAAAADSGSRGSGLAIAVFAIALLLILGLVLRGSIGHLSGLIRRQAGRFRVRRALRKLGRDVLDDFIVPGAYGGLAKIDHAILTAGGILCIRAVTMSGTISGAEEDAQWTQLAGSRRRRFLNPLIQNEGRVRALQKAVSGAPVANLVIFTGAVEFASPMPRNVIHIDDFESFVAKFVFGPSKIDDWDAIWLTLKAAALDSAADRKDFAAQIGFS